MVVGAPDLAVNALPKAILVKRARAIVRVSTVRDGNPFSIIDSIFEILSLRLTSASAITLLVVFMLFGRFFIKSTYFVSRSKSISTVLTPAVFSKMEIP